MTRGVVIKLYGDQQIAGAIADGMAQALDAQNMAVVKREIHDQRVQRSLLRVAVNNTKTDEDYECMTAKARGDHVCVQHGKLYSAVLGVWGLIWYCIFATYDYLRDWNRSE